MSRPKKGPRLWFRPERFDRKTHARISAGQWLILDGAKQIGTGCAFDEIAAAEEQLAAYVVEQFSPPRVERDIEKITVADVLTIYYDDCREAQANKKTFDGRVARLNAWWGSKMLSDITGPTCREYAKQRGAPGGARRDLEDLRAAINHHAKEGLHRGIVRVVLPEKGDSRERWLTRSEAARLVWAAWRFRESQRRHRGPDIGKTMPTKKRPLQHIARFILIALYTGTRAGAVASASPYKKEGRSWVDLDAGLFYRLQEGRKATRKRQPPVKLPANLVAHMRRWKAKKISTSHFVEHNGKPVTSISKGFAHAVELAKLEDDIVPHTLRHTAATWLMQNGVEIWDAAGFLGMSDKVLRDVYGHHHPDYQANASKGFRRRNPSNETPIKPRDKSGTSANEKAQNDTVSMDKDSD